MPQPTGTVNFLHIKQYEHDGKREIDVRVARFICYGIGALLIITLAIALKKHGAPLPSKNLWIALGVLSAIYFCPRTRPMALKIMNSIKGMFLRDTHES